LIWRRGTKGSANVLNAAPLSLEDRLAGGERILLRARPIEIGRRGRLFESIVPVMLPPLTGLFITVVVVSTAARLVALPQAVWTAICIACLAGGWLAGGYVSGRVRAGYRRGLLRGVQPSAVVDSTGIELTLPEVGLQRFDWSDISGLTLRGPGRAPSTWRDKERCDLLGQNGQTLAVVPWALVLPEGDYQLGDYMVAAAPRLLALAPIRCLLPGHPSRNWDGTPNQMLMCVRPAPQATENALTAR
jgi:hypothetical protein